MYFSQPEFLLHRQLILLVQKYSNYEARKVTRILLKFLAQPANMGFKCCPLDRQIISITTVKVRNTKNQCFNFSCTFGFNSSDCPVISMAADKMNDFYSSGIGFKNTK
jgi:hypothetical protein